MNILITICARGGSKGIPGKNIKPLCGKPLIGYTIETAMRFQQKYPNSIIALSTDSEEIKSIAKEFGLFSDYTRPDSLAGDTIGKIDAIADILYYTEKTHEMHFDYVLDLDVTSPLRNMTDLERAFQILIEDEDAQNLFSVSPASRNPYFNMVEQKENGYYDIAKPLEKNILSRQIAPKVYDINASFYFYKRKFFENNYKVAITDRTLIYEVPHICFDLDHPMDFEIINFLIANNKLDFEL